MLLRELMRLMNFGVGQLPSEENIDDKGQFNEA